MPVVALLQCTLDIKKFYGTWSLGRQGDVGALFIMRSFDAWRIWWLHPLVFTIYFIILLMTVWAKFNFSVLSWSCFFIFFFFFHGALWKGCLHAVRVQNFPILYTQLFSQSPTPAGKNTVQSWAQRERELLSVLIYRATAVSTPPFHFCLSPSPLSADVTSYCSLKFSRRRLHRLQGHLPFLQLSREEAAWLGATGHL